jgi:hypothetical protein
VSEGDGAAIDVDAVGRDPEHARQRHLLHGERLVEFIQVDVRGAPASLLPDLPPK